MAPCKRAKLSPNPPEVNTEEKKRMLLCQRESGEVVRQEEETWQQVYERSRNERADKLKAIVEKHRQLVGSCDIQARNSIVLNPKTLHSQEEESLL